MLGVGANRGSALAALLSVLLFAACGRSEIYGDRSPSPANLPDEEQPQEEQPPQEEVETDPPGPLPATSWDELWGSSTSHTEGLDMEVNPLGGFVGSGTFTMEDHTQLGVARYQADGTYIMMVATEITCLTSTPCTPRMHERHAVDASGDIYTVASFNGGVRYSRGRLGPVSVQSPGVGAGFLQKLRTDHQVEWVLSLGGVEGSVRPQDVAALPEGGAVVVGSFEGVQNIGGYSLQSDTVRGFVASVDGQGAVRWARALDLRPDSLLTVAVEPGGSILVGSSRWVDTAQSRPFLELMNAKGETLWSKPFAEVTGSVSGVASLPEGRFAVAGRFRGKLSWGPSSPPPVETERMFLATVELPGAERWLWTGRGTLTALAGGAAGILVAGTGQDSVDLPGQTLPLDPTKGSLFRALFTLEGKLRWALANFAEKPGSVSISGAALLPDGASVYAGSFSSRVDFIEYQPRERGSLFFTRLDPG